MKITIINGSPRKNGATYKILNYFKESLEYTHSNINIEFVNLIDYNFKYCIGCQYCYKTGKCIISDDRIEEIHEIIKNSNGIIWGSPNYATNISGLLRNFHDRVHMTMEQLLYRKPCINIVTYENIDIMANNVLNVMKEMVTHAGGYNVKSIAIKNPFNKDPLYKKLKLKIENSAKKLTKKVQKNKPPLFSVVFSKVALKMFLKPFVYKDKEQFKGIINSWVDKGLVKM
jgi:multimeric flavodoxin WrbA